MGKKTSILLEEQAKQFQKLWEEMLYDPKKAFEEVFLKKLSAVILALEKINRQAASLKTLKIPQGKIEKLLFTPRKLVNRHTSLYEAATSLAWQKYKESDLSHLLYEESKKGVLVHLDFLTFLQTLLNEF